jgi:hypothetical protein
MIAAAMILLQCYATRIGAGCMPFSEQPSLAVCQTIARDYQRFDSRALQRTGVPLVVSYRCITRKHDPAQQG